MSRGKARSFALLRPWNSAWQVWLSPAGGSGPWTLGEECAIDSCKAQAPAILALPARLVIAAPLWLDTADESLLREMAQLDLEVRGLVPRQADENILALRKVRTEGDRSLVVACVFPSAMPEELIRPEFDPYAPSPMLASLPPDACCVWREAGDVVAAFTSGNSVVFWETYDASAGPAPVCSWLERIWIQLVSENVLQEKMAFVDCLDFDSRVARPAFCEREIAESSASGPQPQFPADDVEWEPPHIVERHRQAASNKTRRQILLAAAAAYVVFLASVGGWLGWLAFKAHHLRASVRSVSGTVASLQKASTEWNVLGSSIESGLYPIELLHRIVKKMPSDGLRLTSFEVSTAKPIGAGRPGAAAESPPGAGSMGHIRIEGEASSATAASKFFHDLEDSEDLPGIMWEMGSPNVLPNNTARFAIDGAFSYEAPQS